MQQPFELALHMDAIQFRNINVLIDHRPAGLLVDVVARKVDAAFQYNKPLHEILLAGDIEVMDFLLGGKPYPKPKNLTLDVDFWIDEQSKNGRINKSDILLEGLKLDVMGNFNISSDSAFLDAVFDASSQDRTLLSFLVEENVLKMNPNFLKKGDIYLNGSVKVGRGPLHAVLEFGAQDINLETPDGLEPLEDLGFIGRFDTGDSTDFSSAVLEVKDLKAKLPGGSVNASFRIEDFSRPTIEFICELDADLTGYHKIFKLGLLDSISGVLSLKSDLKTQIDYDQKKVLRNSGTLVAEMKDLSFWVNDMNRKIKNLNGTIRKFDSVLSIDKLTFESQKSDLTIDGQMSNLIYYFLDQPAPLELTLKASSNVLFWADFSDSPPMTYFDTLSDLELDIKWVTTVGNLQDFETFPSGQLQLSNFKAGLNDLPNIESLEFDVFVEDESGKFRLDLNNLKLITPGGSLELPNSSFELNQGRAVADLNWSGTGIDVEKFKVLLPDSFPEFFQKSRINDFQLELTAEGDTGSYSFFPNATLDLTRFQVDFEDGPDVSNFQARLDVQDDTIETTFRLSGLDFDSEIGHVQLDQALARLDSSRIVFSSDLRAQKLRIDQIRSIASSVSSENRAANHHDSQEMNLEVELSSSFFLSDSSFRDLTISGPFLEYRFSDTTFLKANGLEVQLSEFRLGDPEDSTLLAGISNIKGDISIESLKGRVFDNLGIDLGIDGSDSFYKIEFTLSQITGTHQIWRYTT